MFVGGNSGRETPGYPFRTRKLSLPALMVLHPGGCGRVSYRRQLNKTQLHMERTREETTCTSRVFSTFYNFLAVANSNSYGLFVNADIAVEIGVLPDIGTRYRPVDLQG